MKAAPSRRMRKKKLTRKMRGGYTHSYDHSNTYIFYHIYCNTNTLEIVKDQATKIIYSGLYHDVKQIYCFLTGEKHSIEVIKSFMQTLPSKFKVEAIGVNDASYERFTLSKIKVKVNDNDRFLYIHSKGVSRVHAKGIVSECIYLWRNYMEYFLIANYKKCLEKLKDHDIVGVAYKDEQIGPHFSGNFWWSTGKYFKSLSAANIIGGNYHDPEAYIFKGKPKHHKLDGDAVPNNKCLYSNPMYMNQFVDKPLQ
jgi:hypothetical protein